MATGNKPRRCPKCSENNHDSKGDHLWLMKDGETWACFYRILCRHCNTGLGMFKDNIDFMKKAILYLENYG